jgi:hypothetical protein
MAATRRLYPGTEGCKTPATCWSSRWLRELRLGVCQVRGKQVLCRAGMGQLVRPSGAAHFMRATR